MTDSPVELTVICASYQRYGLIHILINSFLCQTLQNWKLLILHDGPDERMRGEVRRYLESCDRIRYQETPARMNDWGHSQRALGLSMADTEFVMFTNDDNYYVPKFTEYMFAAIARDRLDLVICNLIHSHRNPGRFRRDDYHLFDSFPMRWHIDMGNFIVRRGIAQAVGFDSRAHDADGLFIEKLLDTYNTESLITGWQSGRAYDPAKATVRVGKENRVLFVHN